MFDFFKKHIIKPKKIISLPNHPDPIPSKQVAIPPFNRISDLQPKTIEEELRQSFIDYSIHTGQPLFPDEIVEEIIERLKLNLSAKNLLAGVKEILHDRNIKILNVDLFENFIISCKLFYNVRKILSLTITQESFNYLNYQDRYNLLVLSVDLIRKFQLDGKGVENKKLHLSSPNSSLQKLKIPMVLYAESETLLRVFGLTKCNFLSDIVVKEFLKIEADDIKQLGHVSLKEGGNHRYNILASKINRKKNEAFDCVNAMVIDLYLPKIYPIGFTLNYAKAYKQDAEKIINCTQNIHADMVPTEINLLASDIEPADFYDYSKKAIGSFITLQRAAQAIIEELEHHKNTKHSSFFKSKRNALKDFIEDVQFSIDELTKSAYEEKNITVHDQLNDQIENFYTTLFCKILSIPSTRNGSLFFDNAQYWQQARAYLMHCAEIAKNSILKDDVRDLPKKSLS